MFNEETIIGKVKSVTGSRISIHLDERIRSTMPIIDGNVYRVGQIGSFIRIPLGFTNLYGVVSQAGVDAIPENLKLNNNEQALNFSSRWLTVTLVGERIGNKFERGVAQYPTAEDEVHLVTLKDLEVIYGSSTNDINLKIGRISASESLPALLDLNKLVTRHCAVVGSTGSGKSNVVSIIVSEIAKNADLQSQRILIIDPHGEYNECLDEYSKVFKIRANIEKGEAELELPFWALPFDEFVNLFPGALNDAQKDFLRLEILQRKIDAVKHLVEKPNLSSINSDSPIPFSLKKLWFDLDDFERKTFIDNTLNNASDLSEIGDPENLKSNIYPLASLGGGSPFLNRKALNTLTFLNSVRNRILDDRYSFLLKPKTYGPDLDGKVSKDLNELLFSWLGHEKAITIIDLSGVPQEIMTSVSGTLLKIVYDSLFWGQNLPIGGRQQPLFIVLEEAHNYLKAGEKSIASRTVQTIAKEGRKYGAGLLLVTQRPSELDETVLSQCGSVISLRMSNQRDRGHVSSAIQDDLGDLVGILPSLRTGEGLVMGEAVKIPSRIKFDRLGKVPKSGDPNISLRWKEVKSGVEEYMKVVNLWRNANL